MTSIRTSLALATLAVSTLVSQPSLSQTAAPATAGTPEIGRALLTQYVHLKNTKDISRLPELYAEDYIEHTGRNPSGLAALTDNWKSQFQAIPDIKVTLEDAVLAGDKVVARVTYSGTHTVPFFAGIPPTGKAFKFGTIDIWRVAGGKFVEHWDQVDFAGLQRQLTTK
jgi:predicted ester cyclase